MWFANLNLSMNEHHSPFYAHLEPNANFVLEYPYADDVERILGVMQKLVAKMVWNPGGPNPAYVIRTNREGDRGAVGTALN